jgi:hypothetical protein
VDPRQGLGAGGPIRGRPAPGLILYGLAAGGGNTIYHIPKRPKRKAVLFQEVEASVLQEYFFGIQTFLTGEQDHIYIRIDVPHALEGVQAIHLPVQVIVQDDDGGTFIQFGNTGFPIGIKMNVVAEGLQLFSDKALIDDIVLDDKNDWLLIKFHD